MNATAKIAQSPVSVSIGALIERCRSEIATHADHLNGLDCAIGDGDHGTNMLRGFDALLAERELLNALRIDETLVEAGRILVMTIGGASGPLYGTLLIELGRALGSGVVNNEFSSAFQQAVDAVAKRGKSRGGDKTLLDVLYPVADLLAEQHDIEGLPGMAFAFAESTVPLQAMRGRASFLGERSIGHLDPGAASCALLIAAVCRALNEGSGA
jgi:dihydroxyacetone kinase-like protein